MMFANVFNRAFPSSSSLSVTTLSRVFKHGLVLLCGLLACSQAYAGTTGISGFIWNDINGNGVKDIGEPGLAADVDIYGDTNGDGLVSAGEAILSTVMSSAGTGSYSSDPGNGDFVLRGLNAPPQYVLTTDEYIAVTLAGASTSNLNFGFQYQADIVGVIWTDLDNDGLFDPEERKPDGEPLQLYKDNNGDGLIDGGDTLVETVTIGTGSYEFQNVPQGDYIVNVPNTSGDLAGFESVSGQNFRTVTVAPGSITAGISLTYRPFDGVASTVEASVPSLSGGMGTGDGNGDGTPDGEQPHVASIPTSLGAGWFTLGTTPGQSLGSVNVVPGVMGPQPPAGASFPLGFIQFTATVPNPGDAAVLELYVPTSSGINGFLKPNDSGVWSDIATSVVAQTASVTKITISIVDGGPYDSDGTTDGIVTDPGGPVILAALASGVNGVPTLNPAVLMLLSFGLLLVGYRRVSKR